MSENTLFIKASRLKLAFNSTRGQLSVEDLWDIPLSSKNGFSLDAIAIEINEIINKTAKQSFVSATAPKNELNELRLDIVKYVISEQLKTESEKLASQETQMKKKHLQKLIAQKQDEALAGSTLEELQASLDSL